MRKSAITVQRKPAEDTWTKGITDSMIDLNKCYLLCNPSAYIVGRCKFLRNVYILFEPSVCILDKYIETYHTLTTSTTRHIFGIKSVDAYICEDVHSKGLVEDIMGHLDEYGYIEIELRPIREFVGHSISVVEKGGQFFVIESFPYDPVVYGRQYKRKALEGLLTGYHQFSLTGKISLLKAITNYRGMSKFYMRDVDPGIVFLELTVPRNKVDLDCIYDRSMLLLDSGMEVLRRVSLCDPIAEERMGLFDIVESVLTLSAHLG